MIKGYNGYKLLNQAPLTFFMGTQGYDHGYQYSTLVGHHMTHKFGVTDASPLPTGKYFSVVGYADSGDGLEAFVVAIDGTTERFDGSINHITWSLDSNYKAKDSNVLVQDGFVNLKSPIQIDMKPEFFSF